jgi:hypothetical protein
MRSNVIRFPGVGLRGGEPPLDADAVTTRPTQAGYPHLRSVDAGPTAAQPRPARHIMSMTWACLVGYLGGIAVTLALAATGGTRHLSFDLAAFAVLAAVIGWWSRPVGAGCAAVIGWLFYDGFLVGRHAELRLHGMADVWRVGLVVAVAVLASAASYGARRNAAVHPARR